MTEFDRYVEGIEKRKQAEMRKKWNTVLQTRLKECSREQTLAALFSVLGLAELGNTSEKEASMVLL